MRGHPARGLQSRTGPSTVFVVILLLVAAVVALLLWLTIGRDDGGSREPSPTGADPATTSAGPATGVPTISAIHAYDPAGDGKENDDKASDALADGIPSTNWTTVCYAQPAMGKAGVGLVVTLSHTGLGELTFDVGNPPFEVEVYASDADDYPRDFDRWGPALAPGPTRSDVAAKLQVTTSVPARHLLIVLREIGRDAGCSAANPNRGSIGEISFG